METAIATADNPIPILAQLRDAADQRGWVRGISFGDISDRSGRSRDDTHAALRHFRDRRKLVSFTEQKVGDPATMSAIRVTRVVKGMTTDRAAQEERGALGLGNAPEDEERPPSPFLGHVARKAEERHRAVDENPFIALPPPTIIPDAVLVEAHDDPSPRYVDLAAALKAGKWPAIAELRVREAEVIDAAATFERHGMTDLAEAALARLQEATPLERDVLDLLSALIGAQTD